MSEENERVGFGRTYFIPLSDEQFAILGKIAALFGQIEMQIDVLTMHIAGIRDPSSYEAFTNSNQLGTKVTLLKKISSMKLERGPRSTIERLCLELTKLSTDRNHALHGQWGYFKGKKESIDSKSVPAARSHKRSLNPLLASELPRMLIDAENIASLSMRAATEILPGFSPGPLPIHCEFIAHPSLTSSREVMTNFLAKKSR